jgi:hypothetical protein
MEPIQFNEPPKPSNKNIYYLFASVLLLAVILVILKGIDTPGKLPPPEEFSRGLPEWQKIEIAEYYANMASTTVVAEKQKQTIANNYDTQAALVLTEQQKVEIVNQYK